MRCLASWLARTRSSALGLCLSIAITTLLAGCAAPKPSDYAAATPKLDLSRYFNGKLQAHGIVVDRAGKLLQRFTVDLEGRWQGQEGVLEEHFLYADGRREQRTWRLSAGPDGSYRGRAADVVGEALGQAAGNALNWQYTLRLPVGDQVYDVQFDDWMFLVDEQVMLNRAVISKFGLRVGEVLLSFRRL
ncbi:DUF3833 domain-containing protein [Aquabacterium sp.]|uniref:DUF3833 domain-containing protein n=1 Tax=Aquabacterium sp. TaxID=1872578 RepID=UPI0037850994